MQRSGIEATAGPLEAARGPSGAVRMRASSSVTARRAGAGSSPLDHGVLQPGRSGPQRSEVVGDRVVAPGAVAARPRRQLQRRAPPAVEQLEHLPGVTLLPRSAGRARPGRRRGRRRRPAARSLPSAPAGPPRRRGPRHGSPRPGAITVVQAIDRLGLPGTPARRAVPDRGAPARPRGNGGRWPPRRGPGPPARRSGGHRAPRPRGRRRRGRRRSGQPAPPCAGPAGRGRSGPEPRRDRPGRPTPAVPAGATPVLASSAVATASAASPSASSAEASSTRASATSLTRRRVAATRRPPAPPPGPRGGGWRGPAPGPEPRA